mmetsp:Transcript_111550/g.310643  ORF Transcript_111550/g.310643 Transcript_111550/m.310643 type:complete len:248 (+) Transcript_111550:931-1674(+)
MIKGTVQGLPSSSVNVGEHVPHCVGERKLEVPQLTSTKGSEVFGLKRFVSEAIKSSPLHTVSQMTPLILGFEISKKSALRNSRMPNLLGSTAKDEICARMEPMISLFMAWRFNTVVAPSNSKLRAGGFGKKRRSPWKNGGLSNTPTNSTIKSPRKIMLQIPKGVPTNLRAIEQSPSSPCQPNCNRMTSLRCLWCSKSSPSSSVTFMSWMQIGISPRLQSSLSKYMLLKGQLLAWKPSSRSLINLFTM